jgi:hypothetical protein
MENKNITAIEWLRNKLFEEFGFAFSDNIADKAKEIEREQIKIAYDTGWVNYLPNTNAEQYYNKTYGGQNKE